jgi:hypothetical protein
VIGDRNYAAKLYSANAENSLNSKARQFLSIVLSPDPVAKGGVASGIGALVGLSILLDDTHPSKSVA